MIIQNQRAHQHATTSTPSSLRVFQCHIMNNLVHKYTAENIHAHVPGSKSGRWLKMLQMRAKSKMGDFIARSRREVKMLLEGTENGTSVGVDAGHTHECSDH